MAIRYLSRIVGLSFAALLLMPEQAHAQVATDVGQGMATMVRSLSSWPTVLAGFAYILGCYFAVSGIFKFKDHVDESTGSRTATPLSAGVKRFLAGGGLFSLPYMTAVARDSISGGSTAGISFVSNPSCSGPCNGADAMVISFIQNIASPATFLITAFGYVAAILLLITGIVRLTKTAQEGPRGPTGLGTIMTFVVSGALFSFSPMIAAFSASIFGDATSNLIPTIGSQVITDGAVRAQIEPIINALMAFIALVGIIAFMRGWFVLKAFADGQQQATLAQGMTFLIGGAIAINLGQFINMVQQTVGLDALTYGITF